jgi:small-conductance mechanosensitive channel
MKFIVYILVSFIFINLLYGAPEIAKKSDKIISKDTIIANLKNKIIEIEKSIDENIWIKRYDSYLTYRKIEKELQKTKIDVKKYARWKGEKYKELAYQLNNKIKIKENELELINEFKDSPIGRQIRPHTIKKIPIITNPFIMVEAYSYIKSLQEYDIEYQNINDQLLELLGFLNVKLKSLEELNKLEPTKELKQKIIKLQQEVKDFNMVVDVVSTTGEVYAKKIDQVILETNDNITQEIKSIFRLVMIVIILFILSIIAKLVIKRYVEDDDKHYTGNKLVNFTFIVISIFVVLFAYIDNASYLVTVLGFASAGIAIALKDWFMSIFGWMSIMLSGSINPGDRIKVQRDGIEIVGDVLDITLLKIAIREDTTLTSYVKNRRTGRVFFIPNNYVFTDAIANYTFDGLRTVWDVVDVNITFNSNHKKAVELAKNVANIHAKSYTDLAKKRLQKMRKKYVLRNSNPDPRVFAFVEIYGITISTWFHTNSHATLGLKSTIGMEILEIFKQHDDIKLAYPTQTLRVVGSKDIQVENLLQGTTEAGLFDEPIQE